MLIFTALTKFEPIRYPTTNLQLPCHGGDNYRRLVGVLADLSRGVKHFADCCMTLGW
jgi:hypothetical protein